MLSNTYFLRKCLGQKFSINCNTTTLKVKISPNKHSGFNLKLHKKQVYEVYEFMYLFQDYPNTFVKLFWYPV